MEGKMYTCPSRCCVSTQKDLSRVIREELLIISVTICLGNSQNHRMGEIGRDHSPSAVMSHDPTSLLK